MVPAEDVTEGKREVCDKSSLVQAVVCACASFAGALL